MSTLRAKWPEIFTGIAWVVTMATFLGAFGNRPYIAFIAVYAACVVIHSQVRTRFPTFPEPAVVIGWMFLAAFGAFLGYLLFTGRISN